MANTFSRPFITLGTPLLDGHPDHPGGQRFSARFDAGDQVWYYLSDGRIVKDTGITGTPHPPSSFAGSDTIRADYRDKQGILKQTWLKVMPERPDEDGNGSKPLDFDGNS